MHLLTVETEANGEGTQSVQMKGVLLWLVYWALHAGARDFCPALAGQRGQCMLFSVVFTSSSPSHYGSVWVLSHLSILTDTVSPMRACLII